LNLNSRAACARIARFVTYPRWLQHPTSAGCARAGSTPGYRCGGIEACDDPCCRDRRDESVAVGRRFERFASDRCERFVGLRAARDPTNIGCPVELGVGEQVRLSLEFGAVRACMVQRTFITPIEYAVTCRHILFCRPKQMQLKRHSRLAADDQCRPGRSSGLEFCPGRRQSGASRSVAALGTSVQLVHLSTRLRPPPLAR
jgi:hypothetical protein